MQIAKMQLEPRHQDLYDQVFEVIGYQNLIIAGVDWSINLIKCVDRGFGNRKDV